MGENLYQPQVIRDPLFEMIVKPEFVRLTILQSHVTVDTCIKVMDTFAGLHLSPPVFLLHDTRHVVSSDEEAMEYTRRNNSGTVGAHAYLYETRYQQTMLEHFIASFQIDKPRRLFRSEGAAREWFRVMKSKMSQPEMHDGGVFSA